MYQESLMLAELGNKKAPFPGLFLQSNIHLLRKRYRSELLWFEQRERKPSYEGWLNVTLLLR